MKLKKDLIIAIDGYASCGKSTIAKQLAARLNYRYIDTGAMYRAVTLYAIENGLIKDKVDTDKLIASLDKIEINFVYNAQTGKSETLLNGRRVEKEIREMYVSQWVSEVAAIAEVRKFLVAQQQKMGKDGAIVMDGRDIGTVVFPQADLKLFLTASPKERARRRYKELLEKGEKVTFEEVLENVEKRDRIDSTREVTPLTQADDAVVIDNTNINIPEQLNMVLALIFTRFSTDKFEL